MWVYRYRYRFPKCCCFWSGVFSCRHVDLPSGVSWWNMQGLLVCLLNPTHVTVSWPEWQPAATNSSIHVVSLLRADSCQSRAVSSLFIITTLISPPWGVRSWPCTPWAPVQCWSPPRSLCLLGFQSWCWGSIEKHTSVLNRGAYGIQPLQFFVKHGLTCPEPLWLHSVC